MYELLKKLRLTKCAGFPKKFDAGPKGELSREVKQLRDRRRETREREVSFHSGIKGGRSYMNIKERGERIKGNV